MNRVYPLVSVIVRTKDRPILLKKALKSIASQTYRPLEVVLVNDGGCDLDIAVLKNILGDIALQYTKIDKNTGRAHAGNAGLKIARGDYIGFLDDDDEYYPDHIVTLVNILETYDYKAAYTDVYISFFTFDPEKTAIVQKEKKLFTSMDFSFDELLTDNYIPLISLLFRSDVLRDHNGFDENFDMYEDWDLLIRIAEKYPFYHAGKVTSEYIQWSNNLQISQSPLFFDKAAAYHNQIIIKHKNKYASEIIRGLVQSRRRLKEKDKRIAILEHAQRETEDQVNAARQMIQEREELMSGLEKKLQEKEDELTEKDNRIRCLDNAIGDQAKQMTELKDTLHNRDIEIFDLRKSAREKKGYIAELEEKNRQKASAIVNLEAARQEKETMLNRILNSHGWKFLLFYYKARDRIFPLYTRRRSLVKSFVRKISELLKASKKEGSTDNGRLSEKPVFSPGVCAKEREYCTRRTSSEKENQPGEISDRPVYNFDPPDDNTMDMKQESVLVAGIYLADQENGIEEIVAELNRSKKYEVVQKWIALHGRAPSPAVDSVTIMKPEKPQPKFILLNRILSAEKLYRYNYIIFCDDDIYLGQEFVDNFLALQQKYDFALAQPARTHNSYIDHPFVEQFEGLKARRTRFIEIGPVVSIRRDAFPLLLPFDESSCMGWGYDFVWPYLIEQGGLRMGIIDATPIDHSMRKPVKNYDYDGANSSMQNYLSSNPHLSKEEAFRILESYA